MAKEKTFWILKLFVGGRKINCMHKLVLRDWNIADLVLDLQSWKNFFLELRNELLISILSICKLLP